MLQVAHFKDYIPQAFPGGHSMILDAEVLLIDTKTSKPLPFGTLGVHKVDAYRPSWFFSNSFAPFFNFKYQVLTLVLCCALPESRLSRCQCVPFYFRLYLLQWCESDGKVIVFILHITLNSNLVIFF